MRDKLFNGTIVAALTAEGHRGKVLRGTPSTCVIRWDCSGDITVESRSSLVRLPDDAGATCPLCKGANSRERTLAIETTDSRTGIPAGTRCFVDSPIGDEDARWQDLTGVLDGFATGGWALFRPDTDLVLNPDVAALLTLSRGVLFLHPGSLSRCVCSDCALPGSEDEAGEDIRWVSIDGWGSGGRAMLCSTHRDELREAMP